MCCAVYITCMIVIRTLLCANFAVRDGCTLDGQPIAFPFGVVFIPLYIILLVAFNGLVFVTKHVPTDPAVDEGLGNAPAAQDLDQLGFANEL